MRAVRWIVKRAAQWWYRYHVRVRGDEKCPACGEASHHRVKWDPVRRMLVHTCARCEAQWGQTPIVGVDEWLKENEQKQTDTDRHAS